MKEQILQGLCTADNVKTATFYKINVPWVKEHYCYIPKQVSCPYDPRALYILIVLYQNYFWKPL